MILGIETSTREASLAVLDRGTGEIVHETVFVTERAHNAVIFEPIGEIVDLYRNRLGGIVVGLGPGSYGGIRVGIAVANGLGLGMGIPLAGKSSLEAWETATDSYVVIGDARRGSFFVAEVIDRKLQGEPILVETGGIEACLDPLRKKGLSIHTPDARMTEVCDDAILSFPRASALLRRFYGTLFESRNAVALEPHYLRAPYITLPKVKKPGPK